jgi:16S rRNA processing protein RimM
MGKLLKPRGLRGELWMTIFNDVDSALRIGMEVWMTWANGKLSSQIIESLKISEKKSWIKFEGCQKREDADNLIGLNFSIPRSKFTPLIENEIYLVDVIGAEVLDEDRKIIGSVIDIMSFPAQNVVVVETKEGEVLIPYVDAYILLFDKKEKNLIVKNVEGLWN